MQYQPSSSLQDRNLWAPYQRDHLSNGDKIALNKLYPPVVGFGGWTPRQGTTGLYYCGRHNMEDNNSPFDKIGVNGYCGANKGPNCPTCRHYGGTQERRNDEGRKAKQGETGLFYCGVKFTSKKSDASSNVDGVCGPNNGPNCKSCSRLLD
ncbi:unnamed protein product [Rotaria sordida]|uniref:Uncharacterized protein n=1 Tax=Rotaria sordida TaxID=392033 RepID=A0A815HJV2_9BILA|nr:unnamed protein product [Rotaria sordida]CAF3975184.1 unnamed protein product [Rotaria sordida]